MSDAFTLLWPPFLVATALVGIHTYFGLQVLARNIVFVDLALAQVAGVGTTVAYMLGHAPQSPPAYGYSLLFTLLAALLLSATRAWSGRISQEALIGVIYVVAAAAAMLLIDQAPQGAEHIKQLLTGNILTAGWSDLAAIVPLYASVGLLHRYFRDRLPGAWPSEFLFYASFGVVVTSSVALAGVLLVFSFLIVPAAIGALHADAEARQIAIGWAAGTCASALGLGLSYLLDLPTGAAMVCTFGAALTIAGLHWSLMRDPRRAGARAFAVTRWLATATLAISAAWLVVAPRADQPLLDFLERLAPGIRNAYMDETGRQTYEQAAAYAERHRREATRLTRLEVDSRSQGAPLDDFQVQRISSLLKSLNEMRKGEEFVQREVRSRAREGSRWIIAGLGLLAGLMLAPGALAASRRLLRSARSSLLGPPRR
jgi:zinc/manganese transport system permease protein